MNEIDGKDVELSECIVTIIYAIGDRDEVKAKRKYLAHDSITLDDCLEIVGYKGDDTVTVISEMALSGEIYCYGNYGAYWYECGQTKGYA